jgi:protein-disulfide isomerase
MFWKKYNIVEKDLLIPASVLIGSVLISLSILGGAGKLNLQDAAGNNREEGVEAESDAQLTERKGAFTKGSGKIKIIEFSDFQCPYCQKFYNEAYQQIKTKYIDTGKITLEFRHFPLPFHANAQKAAEAFECAGNQGKAFEMHNVIFEKGKSDGAGLSVADLKQYASVIGLNTSKFNSCLDNGETADRISRDLEDGRKAGIQGTPSFFIGGEKVVGALPFNSFETVIEEALK